MNNLLVIDNNSKVRQAGRGKMGCDRIGWNTGKYNEISLNLMG
jgi:hypothetical protein